MCFFVLWIGVSKILEHIDLGTSQFYSRHRSVMWSAPSSYPASQQPTSIPGDPGGDLTPLRHWENFGKMMTLQKISRGTKVGFREPWSEIHRPHQLSGLQEPKKVPENLLSNGDTGIMMDYGSSSHVMPNVVAENRSKRRPKKVPLFLQHSFLLSVETSSNFRRRDCRDTNFWMDPTD